MRAEQARRRRGVWPSREELFESYRARPPFNTWREDVLHIYIEEGTRFREDGQVELKCAPDLEALYYDAVREADFYPLLRQVRCPTLFVWGSENDLERRTAAAAQSAMTYAQSITIPGATHFVPQEKPDEVARILQDDSLYMKPAMQAVRK
jgi:pimeloyl-ACP methyl ester carboxylesterase